MSLMKVFGSFLAAFEFHRFYREIYRPIENQKKIKKTIIANFKGTQYAQDIEFRDNWQDIPLVDYEAIRPYINDISLGKPNILTRNKIIYFAKTSGTISGVKYIPLSKVTLLNQIKFIRAQLFIYLYKTKKYAILNQKMLFLQGSPKLDVYNKVKYGRLSGIVYHFVPSWLISNRHPSYEVNIIEDWSQKVLAIINSLGQRKLSVIGGIPPWVLGFLEKLQHTTNPFIKEISLYIHGGVSISPFYERLRKFLPNTDFLDTYAASEGLFGLSLEPNEATLTLISHSDIYYEFIEFSKPNAPIIDLRDIKTQVVYEIIISNMSGLYRYRIGDLVEFTQINPYEFRIVGRAQETLSAFGEHVILDEIHKVLSLFSKEFNVEVLDFAVLVDTKLARYEYILELSETIQNTDSIASFLDEALCAQNPYYSDLRKNKTLSYPIVHILPQNTLMTYRENIGKVGGQLKIKRLFTDFQFPFI